MPGSWRDDRDNLTLAIIGALVVAGFVFLDPGSLASTLVGSALLLGAGVAWWLSAS